MVIIFYILKLNDNAAHISISFLAGANLVTSLFSAAFLHCRDFSTDIDWLRDVSIII
jgi:hypothetical protein